MQKSNAFYLNILAAILILPIAAARISSAQTIGPRLFAITTSDSIEEIDPVSGETLRSIPKPEVVSPGPDGLAFDGTSLYFISSNGSNTIYELDPESGATRRTINPDVSCSIGALAHSGLFIYGLCHDTSEIHRFDPVSGASSVIYRPGPSVSGGMTFAGARGTLFVSSGEVVLEIDPETGRQLGILILGAQSFGLGFSQASGLLFAGTDSGLILAVDPANGSVQYSFSMPSVPWALATDETPVEGSYLAVQPPSMDFGSLARGETVHRPLVLRSVGTTAVTITSISSPSLPFTFGSKPIPLALTLQPGEAYSPTLAFSPVEAGSFEDEILVSSTDADQPEKPVRLMGKAFDLTTADPGQCYASTGGIDGGRLLLVDTVTGAGSLIADVAPERLPGLAIDPFGNVFAASAGRIYRIDAVTGEAVILGGSTSLQFTAIAFDTESKLFGVDRDVLYQIDRTTGSLTKIGATRIGTMRGLTVDPADGSLWAATPDFLYQLDKMTGLATSRGYFDLNVPLTDIAFDHSGALFGAAGGSSQDNVLVRIDKSTQEATVVGSLGFFSVSGLACDPRVLDGPQIGSPPLAVDFGTVETTGRVSRRITVRNVGTEALSVNEITSPDAPFGLTGLPSLPTVLERFESLTFVVTFASSVDGTFSSSITISSNDPDDAVKTVNLSANAVEVSSAEPGLLYASTGFEDDGKLLTIDAFTGAGQIIGDPPADRLPELAIDSNGRIFASDPAGILYLLDAGTGMVVRSVHVGLFRMAAIAFDNDDNLYGIAPDPQTGTMELLTIDTATGTNTRTGVVDHPGINGMSFHPFDGSLWVTTARQIFTLDTVTGQMALVGATGLDGVMDIQFDLDGNLFVTVARGDQSSDRLAVVDQSTGRAMAVGPIGFTLVSGLSARLGQLEGPQLAVTPSTVNFGQQEVGASRDDTILLRNTGTENVTVDAITAIEASSMIVDQPSTPAILQPGEADTLILRFSPLAVGTFEGSITISSNDPDTPERVLPVRGEAFDLTLAEVGALYGSTGGSDGGRLIMIDPATGVGSLVGNPSPVRLPGLAIDSEGRVYAGDDEGWLHLLDAATGEIRRSVYTELGPLPAISFDGRDVLHAFAAGSPSGPPTLNRLDPATGAAKVITRVQHYFRGMSFNPVDGSLWASGADPFSVSNTVIYQVNPTNGEAVMAGAISVSDVTDLQFDPLGTLYATAGGGRDENRLMRIDRNTWSATVVGPIGFTSVSGLGMRITIEVARGREDIELPTEFALYQNYPNPFNPSTTITFDVPTAGRVVITVYDVLGRRVSTLFDQDLAPGSYSVEWDGRDATARPVASGVFVYRMMAGRHVASKVMTLVK